MQEARRNEVGRPGEMEVEPTQGVKKMILPIKDKRLRTPGESLLKQIQDRVFDRVTFLLLAAFDFGIVSRGPESTTPNGHLSRHFRVSGWRIPGAVPGGT